MTKRVVPDTSVLISGILREKLEKKELKQIKVIIPEFVLGELRAQASKGREIGIQGLEEVKFLRSNKNVDLEKVGRKQTYEEIKLAKSGRVDALIVDIASEQDAILYTSDRIQALNAEAEGVPVEYFEPYEKKKIIKLEKMFEDDIMSLHLKEGVVPLAKRGKPGSFKLVKLGKKKLTSEQLDEMIKEIMDATRYEEDAFIEIDGYKATVVQLGNIRISITRPPFSEAMEITAVRPIAKVDLDDYRLADELKQRLTDSARGILIAGPPGSGKSTFAAAVAEFYEKRGNIIKTLESPRDLQVGPEITQYGKLKGSFENTADLLLLVRPDYSIFDEIRKTEEFEVFSDMRLAGIGMIGVVHATEPVDAVQRFIGRVELGMVPHVVDTVVHIKGGKIHTVYELKIVVRTPTGMTEDDLARPLVEIRNFETDKLEYEIYTYGEEKVIVPIEEERTTSGIKELAKRQIRKKLRKYDKDVRVEITGENKATVRVENDIIARLIGKQGSNINELESQLGISIEVLPKTATAGKEVSYEKSETGSYLVFTFSGQDGKTVNFYANDEHVTSAMIGKNGQVRISKNSKEGEKILAALMRNELKTFI